MSFILARMPATLDNTTGSNEWIGFVVSPGASGSSPFRTNAADGIAGAVFTGTPATGKYSYTFPTSAVRVSNGYVDNVLMRAGVQFSVGGPVNSTSGSISSENIVNSAVLDLFSTDLKLQNTSDRRPVANSIKDVVSGVGSAPAPGPGFPTKNDVSTAACNECHDRSGDPRRRPPRDPVLRSSATTPSWKRRWRAKGLAGWSNGPACSNLATRSTRAQTVAFDDARFQRGRLSPVSPELH